MSDRISRGIRLLPVGVTPDDDQIAAIAGVLDDPGFALLPVAPDDRGRLPSGLHGRALPTDAPVVLAVATTGSTGTPKIVLHTRDSLVASAVATDERIGGPGQWVLALAAHHIAGIQVVLRSALAGTTPVRCPAGGPGFATAFEAATRALTAERRYVSLVPLQLARLLDEAAGRAGLDRIDVVLLGGAAADPALLARAADAGVRVVTTYGSSETSGGCVYDGVPLRGVDVRVGADSVISLAGPVIAHGYLLDDGLHELGGVFTTSDLGELADGRLRVLGRADDVIVTGGKKVAPPVVEAAIRALPGVADVIVVGTPHLRWGSAVSALVVGRRRSLTDLRTELADVLAGHEIPQRLEFIDVLPTIGIGKPDRAAAARLIAGEPAG